MKKLRKLFINIKNKFTLIKLGVHFSRYALFESYRRNNSLIDLSPRHYYSYSKSMIIVFKWILNKYIKYLESNNIIISVNNIVAIGHLYPEIDLLLRELKENKDLQNKIIWFTAPKSKLLIQSKKIFERDNLVIKISGIVHLISTLAMKMRPDLSICVAQSSLNIIKGEKNVSVHEVFQWRQLNRAKKLRENKNEFPLRKYGEIFNSSEIFEKLNILKPYVVVQIKDKAINGTFKPVDPDTYLGAIKYLKSKGYSIVFAGREKIPESFNKNKIINYAESEFANAINDYLIVFNADMILGSGSGYVLMAELLNKPLVTINSWQHVSYIGEKTVLIPTILTKKGVQMKFENQRKYAFSEETLDESNLPIDRGEINANDADSDDILHAIKELIRLKKDGYAYSENQIKLKKINMHNMLGVGASRISEAFIIKNRGIFFDED